MTSNSHNPHIESDKVWIPLEINPSVMTKLAHRLGLSDKLEYVDVFSVTDEDLLAMVPRPIHALIWLFPDSGVQRQAHKEENEEMTFYEGSGLDEPVLWFKQTIGNVCGFMANLHCITNGEPAKHITPESWLDKFLKQAVDKKQTERAKLLYDSEELEAMYKEASVTGDSDVPNAGDEVLYGFIAFVRGKDGNLWELDGSRKGPINRGIMHEDEDLLSERVLGLGIYPYINREKVNESRFSCLALVNAQLD